MEVIPNAISNQSKVILVDCWWTDVPEAAKVYPQI